MKIATRLISSLEKNFWDEPLSAPEFSCVGALRGERISFQVAMQLSDENYFDIKNEFAYVCATAETELCPNVEIREVKQIPVTHPVMRDHDDDYLRTTPGLFPDPLFPHCGEFSLTLNQWRCLWITVPVPQDAAAGDHPVRITIRNALNSELLDECVFTVHVIPSVLPKQTLLHTEWFHLDCIASHYHVDIFSEAHWELIDKFMENASHYGINLLFTPLFTPPVDTAVGAERPTVQLVEVFAEKNGYRFGFDRLDRYFSLAKKHGIESFEFSHLFTQWGAKATPKVVAWVDGQEKRIFGWDTNSQSAEYRSFIREFLQKLKEHLIAYGILQNCWFHISDEPNSEMLEDYKKAVDAVGDLLADCHVIDALLEYSFYERGLIRQPIPPLDVLDDFLEKGFEHPWSYYCCGQARDVSNRMVAMPSYRNRILGWQLYKYQVEGFLQWGYNFWYSFLSRRVIDPFFESGGVDSFPAGDPYMVYPGENGEPIPSLRQMVFYEALQDMRALQLLESLIGREKTVALSESDGEICLKKYPRSNAWMLNQREKINRAIEENLK